MPKMTPLITSWSAGELSPRLHQRSDIGPYKNGAAKMENFLPTNHGPFARRGGTNFTASLAGSSGRIFPFTVNQAIGFIVTVTAEGDLFVNDQSGNVIDVADNLITNGQFVNQGDDWTVVAPGGAIVSFGTGLAALLPTVTQPAAIRQDFVTTNATANHLLSLTMGSGDGRVILRIGTAPGLGDILTQDLDGIRSHDIGFVPGVGNENMSIEIECSAGFPDSFVSKVQVFDLTTAPTEIEFATPYDENDVFDMQWDMPSGEYAMYLTTPKKPVHKLTYLLSTQSWAFAPVTFTNPPAEWTATNNPRTICFFQGRMWLGGTPDQQEKFWASKSGSFEDFTQGDGTAEDDGFEFELDDRGQIEWMAGAKNLVIGTENRELIITSEGGIVKAGDIQAEIQSAYGSRNVQAEQIGNQILYISPDGRKVRETSYEWQADLYTSRDLSFFSEHLTSGRGRLDEIEWMQNPENLIWCVSADGSLLAATYERTYDIIGWSHHITDGQVLSIAVLESFGASQLWMLVRRNVTGFETDLYLEVYDQSDYADSHTTLNFAVPQAAIQVPHLAEKEVTIVADGAVHPLITLDAGGNGTLNYDATKVLVGLPYKSTFESLPLIAQSQSGSNKPSQKRWNKLYVSLLTSHRPIINGQRPPDRTPQTPMNTAEPPKTEYVKITDLGYDLDAIVTIEEDLPISIFVNGIFGEAGEDHL